MIKKKLLSLLCRSRYNSKIRVNLLNQIRFVKLKQKENIFIHHLEQDYQQEEKQLHQRVKDFKIILNINIRLVHSLYKKIKKKGSKKNRKH